MAVHSVVAWDELYESESTCSWDLVFCFDNTSPEKSCFVHDLVCFISHVHKFCVPECLYFVVLAQNCLSRILDYIVMQMRKN